MKTLFFVLFSMLLFLNTTPTRAQALDFDWLMCKESIDFTCLSETTETVAEDSKTAIDFVTRSESYADLALSYAYRNDKEKAEKMFTLALGDAMQDTSGSLSDRIPSLGYVANNRALAGDFEESETILKQMQGISASSKSYRSTLVYYISDIAVIMNAGGETDKAKEWLNTAYDLAITLTNEYDRPMAMQYLARRQAQAGDLEGAVKSIDHIKNPNGKARALAKVALSISSDNKNCILSMD